MQKNIKSSDVIISVLGAFIMAFGLYEVHSLSNITEGGVLGLTLLLEEHFSASPALTSLILNLVCYCVGIKILGRRFLFLSAISTLSFSLSYALLEMTPPVYPEIASQPFIAAVAGAIFIGVGAGLCVRAGGAPSGDDALAMGFSHKFNCKIETVYLISDLTVLVLSLSYIPIKRIVFSVFTVILSGRMIGYIQRRKV